MNCPNCDAEIGFFSYLRNIYKITCKNCDSKFEFKKKEQLLWFSMLISGLTGMFACILSRCIFPEAHSFYFTLIFLFTYIIIAPAGYWLLWRFRKFDFEKRWS